MKIIGLLGGTGWSSTIEYYKVINQLANEKLGGFHSAKILLKSIDYHDIITRYGQEPSEISVLLKNELTELLELQPDSFMICCNTLHKYYDLIASELNVTIPIFHAITLTQQYIKTKNYRKVLLLATKFTMEDGFFSDKLEQQNITVVIPDQMERNEMQNIHNDLMKNIVTETAKHFFKSLITKYQELDAVVIACSEWGLVINSNDSQLPIIDTVNLQCIAAVEYALNG